MQEGEEMSNMINIEKANMTNCVEWLDMRMALWPGNEHEEFMQDIEAIAGSEKENAYICRYGNEYAGFIELSVRHDYVAGSDSSPVGYVEGVYVKPEYRGKGIAAQLVKRGEEWAAEMGCTQMASDAELHNTISHDFHRGIGFTEVERIVCYIKDIRGRG